MLPSYPFVAWENVSKVNADGSDTGELYACNDYKHQAYVGLPESRIFKPWLRGKYAIRETKVAFRSGLHDENAVGRAEYERQFARADLLRTT